MEKVSQVKDLRHCGAPKAAMHAVLMLLQCALTKALKIGKYRQLCYMFENIGSPLFKAAINCARASVGCQYISKAVVTCWMLCYPPVVFYA